MERQSFVAYFRVSTTQQGNSGLGLSAQKEAVTRFAGERGEIIAEFEEIESGKRNDRPALFEAIKLCRRRKATLLVAKLDRLARNVAFIAALMESGVDFIAVDNPHANRLTIHVLSAMAEYERELIAERTKAGLRQAKARGVKLGNPTLSKVAQKGADSIKADAETRAQHVLPIIDHIRRSGVTSLRGIASVLNARGIKTARGGEWHQATVKRVLERASP